MAKFKKGDEVEVPAHKTRSDWKAYTGRVIETKKVAGLDLARVTGHRGRSEALYAADQLKKGGKR